MGQLFLLSQKFELDPNKVCQSEAIALKRTLNVYLRRVGGDKVVKNPSEVRKQLARLRSEVSVSYKLKSVYSNSEKAKKLPVLRTAYKKV